MSSGGCPVTGTHGCMERCEGVKTQLLKDKTADVWGEKNSSECWVPPGIGCQVSLLAKAIVAKSEQE